MAEELEGGREAGWLRCRCLGKRLNRGSGLLAKPPGRVSLLGSRLPAGWQEAGGSDSSGGSSCWWRGAAGIMAAPSPHAQQLLRCSVKLLFAREQLPAGLQLASPSQKALQLEVLPGAEDADVTVTDGKDRAAPLPAAPPPPASFWRGDTDFAALAGLRIPPPPGSGWPWRRPGAPRWRLRREAAPWPAGLSAPKVTTARCRGLPPPSLGALAARCR